MASFTTTTDPIHIKSLFLKYDKNNSNSIDRKELDSLLNDLGVNLPSSDSSKALAMLVDRDNSDSINFDEFYKWWSRLVGTKSFADFETKLAHIEYAARLFWNADCSSDNTLTVSEFKQIYSQLMNRNNVPTSEVDVAVKYLDKNNDGSVQFAELMDWLNWV